MSTTYRHQKRRPEPVRPAEETAGEWTHADGSAADDEGWNLYLLEDGTFEIEKQDHQELFASDDWAHWHVLCQAGLGSELHAKALRLHGTRAPL